MKKLLTFLTLLTLFFMTAGAEEKTITLSWAGNGTQNDGSTLTAAQVFTETANYTGTANAATCATATAVYIAKQQYGLKIGTSSKSGTLNVGITPQVMPSRVVFRVASYNTSTATTVKAILNGVDEYTLLNASKDNELKDVTVEMDGNTQLSGIKITATKYSHLKSITIYYDDEGGDDPTPITYSLTLPTGLTGGSVTATGYSDLTAIPAGTNMTVTATPSADTYELDWMKANDTEVTSPYTFKISENTTITAAFKEKSTTPTGDYLFYESFDKCASTGGNDGSWSGSIASSEIQESQLDNSGWTKSKTNTSSNTEPKVYAANKCVKVHQNTIYTTPSINVTSGLTYTLTFKAAAWNASSESTNLKLYCEGGTLSTSTETLEKGAWTEYTVTVTATSSTINIGFGGNGASNSRFFLDEVKLNPVAAGAHNITVGDITGEGTISASVPSQTSGETVTVTANPGTGYELTALAYNGTAIDITSTPYTFTMPDADVTLTATFSKIKYTISTAVSTTAAGNAGCAVWMKDGFETINNAATSTVGTTVEFALHPVNNWMIDPSNAPTVTFGEGQSVAVTAGATDNEGATHYTFTMPASDVTITGHFVPYAPDVYFLEGDLSNWDNGKKMTYNSADKTYSIRVYFSDEYGFFRFRAGDNTYASGAEGEWWPISENGEGESHFGDNITLYKGSSKRFRVPAGIYDIKVGQVFDDPTASNNPNWWGETTVTVTKVEPTLTFNPAAGEVPNNQVVTVSSNLYELLSAINSDVVENDVTNMVKTDGEYAANVTLTADATVTGRAKYGYIEKTATAKYTISQENTNTQYKLIKSADDLVNGKKYLVVGTYPSDSKTFVMGAYSEPRLSAVDATPENDIIEATADMRIVTLEAVGTNWALKTDDGYVYTNSTTSNGYAAYVENQEPAVVIFESETTGELNIKFVNNDDKGYLTPQRFGNSSNYFYGFGGYASATSVNASHLFLYRQVEEVVTLKVETPVITPGTGTYAEAKDVEITCSTPGATIWYKYGNMTDYAEYTEALTISENTTLSAYATKDGYNDSDVATATYTFSELSDEIFTLVTSEDQLIEGNEYIIVAATDTYKPALGAIESRNGTPANGYTFETAGDYSVLTLAAESDVNIFTLGKVEVTDPNDKFYWTFKDKDGNFLYADVSGGAIDTDNQSNYSHVYKINIGEGTHYNNYATIQGSANYQIEYRTDDEIFRHYACSNVNQTGNVYKKVLLYTRGVQQTPIMTLADICKYGVTTEGKNEYIIADKLQAVYAYTKGGNSLLWCKDLGNKSINPTTMHPGQIDFMRSEAINYDTEEGVHNGQQGEWDQSNWIVLQFTNPTGPNNIDQMLQDAQDKFIKPGTIRGKLVDNENYILKMELDQLHLVTQADPDYDEEPYNENVYCPANFLPENLNIHGGIANGDGAETGNQNYFFMNPKVQEICEITYAKWDSYGYFAVPSGGPEGAFQVGWVYQDKPELEPGRIYKFHAVVHRVGKEYGPNNPISTKDGMPVYENITVLPIDLTSSSTVVTAINTVEASNAEVKGVKYVNVAGMVSDRPFQGVNIVVTEYTDGTSTTSKMLRK